MKPIRIVVAVVAFLLPLLARGIWFYRGIYTRPEPVTIPDYAGIAYPQPPLSSATVSAPGAVEGHPVVLFDTYHGNVFNMSELENLTTSLSEMGAVIEVSSDTLTLDEQLSSASSYVIIAPVYYFTGEEISAIQNFVQRGGRLLTIIDPTRVYYDYWSSVPTGSADVVNLVLAPFNVAFANDYVYNVVKNEGNFRHIILDGIVESPFTVKLNEVVFYSASSISAGEPLITGDSTTLSSITDAGGDLPLAAMDASGNILAIGDVSFMTEPYIQVSDNRQLTMNIAGFLAGGSPQRDLVNFPYLFNRTVTITTMTGDEIVDEDTAATPEPLTLDQDMLDAIASIQSGLGTYAGVPVQISSTPIEGNDLIILGLLPAAETLQPYLEEFGLVFPGGEEFLDEMTATPSPGDGTGEETIEATSTLDAFLDAIASSGDTESIIVPGFGKLSTETTGLLLYSHTPERNTLILLAGSQEALMQLAELLNSNTLTGCVVQNKIAACQVSTTSDWDY